LCVFRGGGCAGVHSALTAPSKQIYVVSTESTGFYSYSPRQGNGPDKTLPRNTAMHLIRASYDFSKVHLETGEDGFVASSDIGPNSSQLTAATTLVPPVSAPASEWRAELPEPRPPTTEPPLPEFEPTPIPTPAAFGN
jgi:hypothetical protein